MSDRSLEAAGRIARHVMRWVHDDTERLSRGWFDHEGRDRTVSLFWDLNDYAAEVLEAFRADKLPVTVIAGLDGYTVSNATSAHWKRAEWPVTVTAPSLAEAVADFAARVALVRETVTKINGPAVVNPPCACGHAHASHNWVFAARRGHCKACTCASYHAAASDLSAPLL